MRVQEVQGDTYLCAFWFRERRGGHTHKNEKSNEVLIDMDLARTKEVMKDGQGRNHARRCEGWIRQEKEISGGED